MRRNIKLKSGERIDELERKGYGIIQREKKFCFGMDAVLLSGYALVKKGEIAVDLGTGTGIIPILLEAKSEGAKFIGVEIQPDMAQMAERSVYMNGLEEKIKIICGDLKEICHETKNQGIKEIKKYMGQIDAVTANPPYIKSGFGLKNPGEPLAIARHELKCTLADVCEAASVLLTQGGRFYMVHRPFRLPEIIHELQSHRLEPKKIKPVYPLIDRQANMILIEAVKDGKAFCRIERPLVIYKELGSYSDEIFDIYGY